ncbi:MAG: hypothetical protein AB7I19_19255 [Planctomycetota bacterium]
MRTRVPTSILLLLGSVTLGITVLRLLLELNGNASTESGGGGFLLGISWLPPLIGFWLGRRQSRLGLGIDRPWRLTGLALIALVALVGVIAFGFGRYLDGKQSILVSVTVSSATSWLLAFLVARSWPGMGWSLFFYAILARAGVIAVTLVCLANDWTTHYTQFGPPEKLWTPPDMTAAVGATLLAQLGVWVGWTLLSGLLGAGLGAATAARHPVANRN